MALALASPAFESGCPIPPRHARDGDNVSPFLQWEDPPPGTRSFVLVMEDADAPVPTFRHWAVYDIPAGRRHLAEGRSSGAAVETLPHGYNDFGHAGYDGPNPPAGGAPHTYRYRLLALDVPSLGLDETPQAGTVVEAARDHILSEAELTGTYPPTQA